LKQQDFVSPILEFPLLRRCHQTDFLSAQCCTADKEKTVHQKQKLVLSIQQQNRNKKIQEKKNYICSSSSNSMKEIPLEFLAGKKKNLNSRSSNVVFKPSARIPQSSSPPLHFFAAAAAASHIYYRDRFQFSHRSKYS
jgi:hypothetical protein